MKKIYLSEEEIMIILMIIAILFSLINSKYQKNKCIENDGKVITDSIGLFDKCIYGDKNE